MLHSVVALKSFYNLRKCKKMINVLLSVSNLDFNFKCRSYSLASKKSVSLIGLMFNQVFFCLSWQRPAICNNGKCLYIQINCLQVSISPTFYSKFLHAKIPKAQKDTDNLTVFFLLLAYSHVKTLCKHVGEMDSRILIAETR